MSGQLSQIQRRALGGAAIVDRGSDVQHRIGTADALMQQLEKARQEKLRSNRNLAHLAMTLREGRR